MEIKEKLKQLISISAVIVKSLDEAEKELSTLLKQKDAVERDINTFKEENLSGKRELQVAKNAFIEYEKSIRNDLTNQKNKLDALVKDAESKEKLIEKKLQDAEKIFSDASTIKQEAESLKAVYESKIKKFNDAISK